MLALDWLSCAWDRLACSMPGERHGHSMLVLTLAGRKSALVFGGEVTPLGAPAGRLDTALYGAYFQVCPPPHRPTPRRSPCQCLARATCDAPFLHLIESSPRGEDSTRTRSSVLQAPQLLSPRRCRCDRRSCAGICAGSLHTSSAPCGGCFPTACTLTAACTRRRPAASDSLCNGPRPCVCGGYLHRLTHCWCQASIDSVLSAATLQASESLPVSLPVLSESLPAPTLRRQHLHAHARMCVRFVLGVGGGANNQKKDR